MSVGTIAPAAAAFASELGLRLIKEAPVKKESPRGAAGSRFNSRSIPHTLRARIALFQRSQTSLLFLAALTLLLAGAAVAANRDTGIRSNTNRQRAIGSSAPHLPCVDPNETLCGDGGPAVAARLLQPAGVEVDKRGGFLIADTANDAVRRVRSDETITTIAGLGTPGYSGDSGPAVAAQLRKPSDVSSLPSGAVLIADAGNDVIRRVSPKGVITTVAGVHSSSLSRPPSTSPWPATRVRLSDPEGVAGEADGGFLIADAADNRVLRVSPRGQLRVVAGTSARGYSGDGGSALQAELDSPTRVIPAHEGGFFVLDLGNHVVRWVSAGGVITTVPASRTFTETKGGGSNPGGLAEGSDGQLYVVTGHTVAIVLRSGFAFTVAGSGECGSSGDAGPAVRADLAQPAGIAVTDSGDLLIADINDGSNAIGNVRKVISDQTIETVAGPSDTGVGGCILAGGAPSGSLWPIFYITMPRHARALRAITIKFATTRKAIVSTSLLRKGRRVRGLRRLSHPGINSVTLSPGVASGSYTMRISANRDLPNNNPDEGGTVHLSKRFEARLPVRR